MPDRVYKVQIVGSQIFLVNDQKSHSSDVVA
jgi:hypothetical protein